jgi:septal ring factor EnvC (AmiA/AmiB activator)
VEIINKVWKKSIIGTLCAGGLYAGVLYNVQDQVNAADIQKNAYMQKVQERNHLIKKLNNYNQKLYQLQLTYTQTVNETDQKSQQINALNSEIAQVKNQIASTGSAKTNTSSSTSSVTTQAQTVVKPSTPAPPPPRVQSVTKAS